MERSNVIVLLIILLVLIVAGWFVYQSMNPSGDAKDSEATKSLVGAAGEEGQVDYKDLEGNTIDLEQYAGRIRVVNSWATWTPFSKEELKYLDILASELPAEEGVVLAINRAEQAVKVKALINKIGPLDNIVFVQDTTDHFYNSVDGFAMPETIFYDRYGKVVFHKRGHMTLDEMRVYLNAARESNNDNK
jgi:thiol-disulfide isomerase/thioredoxin